MTMVSDVTELDR